MVKSTYKIPQIQYLPDHITPKKTFIYFVNIHVKKPKTPERRPRSVYTALKHVVQTPATLWKRCKDDKDIKEVKTFRCGDVVATL